MKIPKLRKGPYLPAFLEPRRAAEKALVADNLRPEVDKLAALMDSAETDVRAFMTFPKELRAKLHSTNFWERLNKEVRRRTDVVGSNACRVQVPNETAVERLVGAVLLEHNEDLKATSVRADHPTLHAP